MKRPEIGLRIGAGAGALAVQPAYRLTPADVDLWRVPLDAQTDTAVAELLLVLSPDEQTRARTFFFERDRRRFTIGRGILRLLLARYLGCEPTEVVFRYGANGKPELASPAATSLHFNLAHSEGQALFGFTRAGDIGVDLEHIRELPDWEFIASTCFNPEERSRVAHAAPNRRLKEFFAAWTRQEAALKATGIGLGGEVRWRPANAARPEPRAAGWGLTNYTDGYNPAFSSARRGALRLYPVHVQEDYAATLAVGANARWASCFTWEPTDLRNGRRGLRRRRVRLDQSVQSGVQFL